VATAAALWRALLREVVDGSNLSELVKAYRGSGSASYRPAMLLGLLVHGYATKTFSSRAIERLATHSDGIDVPTLPKILDLASAVRGISI
jgi:hypothetical protein